MTEGLSEEVAMAELDSIPREWLRWAAVSLMRGSPVVDVLARLRDQGYSENEAIRFCSSVYDQPSFEAGQWLAQQLDKVYSMLGVRDHMRSLSSKPIEVECRSGVSREEFLDGYYSENIPVILTDVCDSWPALSRWNPAYLVEKLGALDVEVMTGRESDPAYEVNSNQHKFTMPFDEYVAKVEASRRSNDTYLVANNHLLASPAAASLWDDFVHDQRYLREDATHSQAFLWFGPAGTITPLHHDSLNVLFNQVHGRKHFILIPALEIHRVYNGLSVYSDVDPLEPDLDEYPLFEDVQRLEFDLGPGESVFIPTGWWHHVESLDTSMSVSFTNFAFDNDVDWVNPTMRL